MIPGVNIEEVKKYNASLKEYKDKSSKIQAGIEFSERELNRLCQELTTSLGVQVTPENIEKIREDFIARINNTLSVGMDIINRIKSEEAMISESRQGGPGTPGMPGPMGAPGMPGAPAPGPGPMSGPGVAEFIAATQGVNQQMLNIVSAPQPTAPSTPSPDEAFRDLGSIPPMFGSI